MHLFILLYNNTNDNVGEKGDLMEWKNNKHDNKKITRNLTN